MLVWKWLVEGKWRASKKNQTSPELKFEDLRIKRKKPHSWKSTPRMFGAIELRNDEVWYQSKRDGWGPFILTTAETIMLCMEQLNTHQTYERRFFGECRARLLKSSHSRPRSTSTQVEQGWCSYLGAVAQTLGPWLALSPGAVCTSYVSTAQHSHVHMDAPIKKKASEVRRDWRDLLFSQANS